MSATEDKMYIWPPDLSKRLVEMRFENDWLFRKKKQPWKAFHRILMNHGFPEEITAKQVAKRWSYIYEMYKIAKASGNKSWKYYKMFENHYSKAEVLDKFDTWNNEWRLKLITCVREAKELKVDYLNLWITVERALRCQNLPENCFIQDIKRLWHHLKTTFGRKHRMKLRKGTLDWPLYDAMLEYYERFEPDLLAILNDPHAAARKRIKKSGGNSTKYPDYDEYDFQWSKDITETFIQVRLQNDWLFRAKKWAWKHLLAIMIQEYGFPKELTSREICRKWASTFADYQKAIATNNKSWVYYPLFESYLGEGSLSLNPLLGWQEEWVFNLISARIDLDHLFKLTYKEQIAAWREVEKRLRSIGLPIDHSLLQLPEIWTHLQKTYRWKKKFARKGILTEQWPYFEAMSQYDTIKPHAVPPPVKKHKQEPENDGYEDDDDYEDDIKLFDLKQKLEREVKPKFEYLEANQCRACSGEDGCVNIYQQRDDVGLNLADKLRMIGDVQVDPTDHLPSQICLNCVRDLEHAFKFRQKCQQVDKELRNPNMVQRKIKIEVEVDDNAMMNNPKYEQDDEPEAGLDRTDIDDLDHHYDDIQSDREVKEKKPRIKRQPLKIPKKKKRVKKEKYEYFKVCDICGKHTRNLANHIDMHATTKAYSCDICDKKFKFKSGLVLHKSAHATTPKKTCEICGKSFNILAQYRRHFVYHANERKFECETCGKRFNTLDILRVHNRTHTDERPFPCPICGKTFRTAGCVSRHKRIVHRTTTKSQ